MTYGVKTQGFKNLKKYLCSQNRTPSEELPVVGEVSDVIVVFAVEKLLNVYFGKKNLNLSQ